MRTAVYVYRPRSSETTLTWVGNRVRTKSIAARAPYQIRLDGGNDRGSIILHTVEKESFSS